jgi:hypothetical protein
MLAPSLSTFMKMPELRGGVRSLLIPTSSPAEPWLPMRDCAAECVFGAIAVADVISEFAFLLAALFLFWTGWLRWTLAGGLGDCLGSRP